MQDANRVKAATRLRPPGGTCPSFTDAGWLRSEAERYQALALRADQGLQFDVADTYRRQARLFRGLASDLAPERRPQGEHRSDADCTLDEHDVCTACGVYHGDPCARCAGRGYHEAGCPEIEPQPEARP